MWQSKFYTSPREYSQAHKLAVTFCSPWVLVPWMVCINVVTDCYYQLCYTHRLVLVLYNNINPLVMVCIQLGIICWLYNRFCMLFVWLFTVCLLAVRFFVIALCYMYVYWLYVWSSLWWEIVIVHIIVC